MKVTQSTVTGFANLSGTSILHFDKQTLIHYVAAVVIIVVYGTQVCPYVEGLTASVFMLPVSIVIFCQWALKRYLISSNVYSQSLDQQTQQRFYWEYIPFILSGLILAFSNMIFYGFPLGSGIKIILGLVAIGYYVALDLSLRHERELIKLIDKNKIKILEKSSYFPIMGKFKIFSSISLIFLVSILGLLIIKDLEWLASLGSTLTPQAAKFAVIIEIGFAGTLLLAYILLVISSYAKNLLLIVKLQKETLKAVTHGDLEAQAIVVTKDEFGEIAQYTNKMIKTLNEKNKDIQRTQDITILSLGSLAETRDNETGMHLYRTQHYVRNLALQLQSHPDFADELSDEVIELLFKSSPLHDIGKVGIPDAILLKQGKLTPEEFTVMKTHTEIGAQSIQHALGEQTETSFLRYAKEIAATHHEKWDGSGYPQGLAGDAIPLSGRIMAVADVYDALISRRIYKPPFSHEKAMSIIRKGSGKHFDPRIIETLSRIEHEFVRIARQYADEVPNEAA